MGTSDREEHKLIFKAYDEILDKSIRMRKKAFYTEQFSNHYGNIKKTWENIKSLLNKNQQMSSFPSVFVDDERELSDPKSIADGFNNFFTDIGPNLAEQINSADKPSFRSYLPSLPEGLDFNFKPTSDDKVRKIINNFISKPSSGDDEFSSIFIKHPAVMDLLVPYLTLLINQSTDGCMQMPSLGKAGTMFGLAIL